MPTRDQILDALGSVIDPELHKDIVTLGMVRRVEVNAIGVVDVTVSLTTAGCPIRDHFETGVNSAIRALDGVIGVNLTFDVLSDSEKAALRGKLGTKSLPDGAMAQITNVICVGSGKGGVGKSSVTANLAAALTNAGKSVGVMDADVWGYSQPRMFGLSGGRAKANAQRKIEPLVGPGGIKVVSIGFFVDEESAVVWRGPMLHKALQQFLEDVAWGSLDYLLIDLPPGTGDVSMTLAQLLPQARFVIVTTPQAIAQTVARRSAEMASKLSLEVIGIIENMAGFTTPDGVAYPIFGEGGGRLLAEELEVPLLGQIPLTMALREQSDGGLPVVLSAPEDPASQAITRTAARLISLDGGFSLPMAAEPAAAESAPAKPVGMSLPMA